MVLRQNATRRRRIVIDPKNQGNDAEVAPEEAQKPPRKRNRTLYKSGAERRFQWKTTDLLPKRTWGMATTIALLLLSLVGINLLYFYSGNWHNYIGTVGVSSLQLSGKATLAAWFSSFLLIISGFASLQIYALRQHRQDDYRGSYRLWLWMSGVLLLASLNCIVDLTAMGTNLISGLTKLSFQSSLLSMIGLKIVLLTALVARGSYEVRESRTSLMLVVLVWLAYGAATTLQLPQFQPVMARLPQSTFQIAHGNLILFGTAFVFLAQLVFARFVYLQALGMIQQRFSKARKSTSKSNSKSKATSSKPTKKKFVTETDKDLIDEESSKPETSRGPEVNPRASQPTGNSSKAGTSSPVIRNQEVDSDDESEQDTAILSLSKSEQRRLRKQQQSSSHRKVA
jgi:hypothetical protein